MKRRLDMPGRQRGVVAVHFGLAAGSFVIVIFVMIEVLRAIYVWNMLAAVTRQVARAAIVTAPSATGTLETVTKRVILADDDRKSTAFGADVTIDTVRVKYLNSQFNVVSSLPLTGDDNVHTCDADPTSANCVRFVQVQICEAGTDCRPLQFKPALSVLPAINMPTFLTILPAQSLACTGDCT